jgi:hypothetical protein
MRLLLFAMAAVITTVRELHIDFLTKCRKYCDLDVGLLRVYTSRNGVMSLIKRLEGRSSRDRYFEKVEEWEPDPKFQHPLF